MLPKNKWHDLQLTVNQDNLIKFYWEMGVAQNKITTTRTQICFTQQKNILHYNNLHLVHSWMQVPLSHTQGQGFYNGHTLENKKTCRKISALCDKVWSKIITIKILTWGIELNQNIFCLVQCHWVKVGRIQLYNIFLEDSLTGSGTWEIDKWYILNEKGTM